MLIRDDQRLGVEACRDVIARHGWATMVSAGKGEPLAATHVPCVPCPSAGRGTRLAVLGHVARADPLAGAVATAQEVLLIFQGPHGYVSASWYGDGRPHVPTWNHVTVHVRGRPELLEGEAARTVLDRTTRHFERRLQPPFELADIGEHADRLAGATACFRVEARLVDGKAKLSQEQPAATRARLIAGLDAPGPYHQPELAAAMRRCDA